MQKYSLHWTSLTVAVAALIGLMSAAQASSVCYNQNAPDFSSAGTVCVDVQPRAFSSAVGGYVGPTLTGASPQSSGGPLSVTGVSGGTGDSASGAAAAGFGAVHLYAESQASMTTMANPIVQAVSESYASFSDKFTASVSTYATFSSILEGSFVGNGYGQSQVRLFDLNGSSADLLYPTLSFFQVNQFQSSVTQSKQVSLNAGDTYFLYYSAQVSADSVYAHGQPTPNDHLEFRRRP